jgi:TrkA domain protein
VHLVVYDPHDHEWTRCASPSRPARRTPDAGRRLGDTDARTRTGASIVAVLRDGHTITSLTPDFTLLHGDQVAVVGDAASVAGVRELLITG